MQSCSCLNWTSVNSVSAQSADPAAASLLGERSAETRVRTSLRHFTLHINEHAEENTK